MEPKVSILVLNYNGESIIRDCLLSIMTTTYSPLRVFAFDNGSTDSSKRIISNFFDVQLLSVEKNLGFTKGANEGISRMLKETDAEYIIFFTNDVKVIEPEWITKLIAIAEQDKSIGIVGCKLLYPDGTIQHAGMEFWPDKLRGKGESGERYAEISQMDAITGAVFLIKRQVLELTGGFDEAFSPFYYEDLDLCFRARKLGYKIIFAGNVALVHDEGATIKPNVERESALARNSMIFYKRYAPLKETLKMIGRIYLRLLIQRKDARKPFGIKNLKINNPIYIPFRAIYVSIGILNGLINCLG